MNWNWPRSATTGADSRVHDHLRRPCRRRGGGRSWHGRAADFVRRAVQRHAGRIRADDVEHDVIFEETDASVRGTIDEASVTAPDCGRCSGTLCPTGCRSPLRPQRPRFGSCTLKARRGGQRPWFPSHWPVCAGRGYRPGRASTGFFGCLARLPGISFPGLPVDGRSRSEYSADAVANEVEHDGRARPRPRSGVQQ